MYSFISLVVTTNSNKKTQNRKSKKNRHKTKWNLGILGVQLWTSWGWCLYPTVTWVYMKPALTIKTSGMSNVKISVVDESSWIIVMGTIPVFDPWHPLWTPKCTCSCLGEKRRELAVGSSYLGEQDLVSLKTIKTCVPTALCVSLTVPQLQCRHGRKVLQHEVWSLELNWT